MDEEHENYDQPSDVVQMDEKHENINTLGVYMVTKRRGSILGVEFWLPCSDEHVIWTIVMYAKIGDRVRIK
jgi:hypothetical protein